MSHLLRRFLLDSCFLLVLTVASVLLAGCAPSEKSVAVSQDSRGNGVWNDPTGPVKSTVDAVSLNTVKEASQNQAQRLSQALALESPAQQPPRAADAQVRWIRTDTPADPPHKVAVSTAHQIDAPDVPVDSEPSESFAAQWSKAEQPLDRQRLLARLRKELRSGGDADLDKAITAIGLSLFDSDRKLSEQDLDSMDQNRRATVRRYHQVMVALAEQLTSRTVKWTSTQS